MGGGSSRHVLVVDDDPSIRLLCKINLEFDGWNVREAANLGQAREHLADGAVRIVLLDVHVGPESGAAFLEEIRRLHPDVRVAMLTGSVGGPTLDAAAADGIVPKPFTIDDLTRTVERLAV